MRTHEDDNQCTTLVDPLTKNLIFNAAKLHENDVDENAARFVHAYGVSFHSDLPLPQKSIWCDGKVHVPCQPGESFVAAFKDDARPTTKLKEIRYAEAIARLATQLACALQQDNCTINCINSRSRSPAVVAAFYILFRGCSAYLDGLLVYLTSSMQQQRPVLAKRAADKKKSFPNFDKFKSVLQHMCSEENVQSIASTCAKTVAAFNKTNRTSLELEQLRVGLAHLQSAPSLPEEVKARKLPRCSFFPSNFEDASAKLADVVPQRQSRSRKVTCDFEYLPEEREEVERSKKRQKLQ
jgi:hypothetical protein